MANNQSNQPFFTEDSALLELVVLVKRYGGEVVRSWKLILIVIACVVGLSLIRKFFIKTTYEAELTFMVNEDEGSKLSGFSTALENIGFGLGSTNSEYNLEKIMQLMRSKRIIYSALLTQDSMDGEFDYLANHVIRAYDLHNTEWKKRKAVREFWFTHDSLEIFTRQENTALVLLFKKVMGSGGNEPFLSSEILDLPAIMEMSISTVNEDLSNLLVCAIYEKLSSFYIDKTTEKQRETYELVAAEADSLRQELVNVEYALASFDDQNQGLVGRRAQIRRDQLEREMLLLATIYSEAVKNQEVAKFTLQKETPFIQPIDYPVEPLKKTEESLVGSVSKGIVLGLILSVVFLLGRLFYRDVMAAIPKEA